VPDPSTSASRRSIPGRHTSPPTILSVSAPARALQATASDSPRHPTDGRPRAPPTGRRAATPTRPVPTADSSSSAGPTTRSRAWVGSPTTPRSSTTRRTSGPAPASGMRTRPREPRTRRAPRWVPTCHRASQHPVRATSPADGVAT
jgi:hypothetical protein